MKHVPRAHQREAIQEVVDGFQSHERGQLIMACGTGKTLTALWVAEATKVKLTVVFLPSISLLLQYALSWRDNHSMADYDALCVCSDMSLSRGSVDDLGVASLSDSGFVVTTDSGDIERFMRGSGSRVVFCTYQSACVIAATQTGTDVPNFDLAICDEAHRCAGDITSPFAIVLDAKKIRADRRLFATATPKDMNARRKSSPNVIGMDNEAVFGPRFHTLPFRKAIDLGLLCDYQVVVVLSDNEELRTIAKHVGDTQRDRMRVVEAGLVGVVKAIDTFSLKKVITFHHTLNNASNFQQDLATVAQAMRSAGKTKASFTASFISGNMSAARRRDILARFGAAAGEQHHVLTNARCLTEGIDVPSVDGIVFVDPRTSEVDIAQALGRALRISPGKTIGTVVLPILLGKGESIEEVVQSTDFRSIWRVLSALRSHDEEFAASLNINRSITISGGSSSGGDPLSKVSFIGSDAVREISDVLRPVVVEELSDKWEAAFELARQRAERLGSCNAMLDETWPPEDPNGFRLGVWLKMQRDAKSGNDSWMSPERIRKLESIGMVWDLVEARWHASCDAVLAWIRSNGTASVPRKTIYTREGWATDLYDWSVKQRRRHRRGELAPEKVEKLSRGGFSWDPMSEKFERGFAAASEFFREHGHCNAPTPTIMPDGFKLSAWIVTQRLNKAQGTLSAERIERLEGIGIQWNRYSSQWDRSFSILEQWISQHGHANVPAKAVWSPGTADEFKLGVWLGVQRKLKAKDQLSRERATRLQAAGVQWNGVLVRHDGNWDSALQRLEEFIRRFGSLPPADYACDDGMRLGSWLRKQRGEWQRGGLKPNRVDALAALGIAPKLKDCRPQAGPVGENWMAAREFGPMFSIPAPLHRLVAAPSIGAHGPFAAWQGKRNRRQLSRKDISVTECLT
ncbi:DEAD/DEAH box helicase [Cupriavidus pauculus]|uniref:DEAD/DEAH box helicase n=1 Tax=Cupriavidus pauculus TaxID=82633 RepID=UPI001D0C66A7|nr:DEAD/DEAH box helicase [Cupriavidus pauculus]